jgi:hypothetical protein
VLLPLAAALEAAGFCNYSQGAVNLPGPVSPGQATSATIEFGAVKASTGAAAGELVIEELPAAAKDAGWSVDSLKLSVPAGEKRPLVVRFTAPPLAKLQGTSQGALAEAGLPSEQQLMLNCSMKGGCQAVPGAAGAGVVAVGSDGVRRVKVVCRCTEAMPAAAAAAAGGGGATAYAVQAGQTVAASAGSAGGGAGAVAAAVGSSKPAAK